MITNATARSSVQMSVLSTMIHTHQALCFQPVVYLFLLAGLLCTVISPDAFSFLLYFLVQRCVWVQVKVARFSHLRATKRATILVTLWLLLIFCSGTGDSNPDAALAVSEPHVAMRCVYQLHQYTAANLL